jgi:hypothetical protein
MAESMSNLERYLRQSNGINIMLRRRMIASYTEDGSITAMRALLNGATEHQLTGKARTDLEQLIENEDARVSPVLPA